MRNVLLFISGCALAFHPLAVSAQTEAGSGGIGKTNVKKNIFSFGFFSPTNHHLSFGYDRIIGGDILFTAQAGYIGLIGIPPNESLTGGFVEAGIKLFFHPDYMMVGMKRYNAIQGGYLKPLIAFSGYQKKAIDPPGYPTLTFNYQGLAIMLCLGRQWVLSHNFLFDMYAGAGYMIYPSTAKININEPSSGDFYSFIANTAANPPSRHHDHGRD